jgi:phenylacetate-CoA ligase
MTPLNPLEVFAEAAERVPAYRKFLINHLGGVPSVRDIEAFERLPFTDKKSYILAFPLEDLCLDGTLRGKHFIYRSSGTTLAPVYWPKLPEEERDLPKWLEAGLVCAHAIDVIPTLVIVGLGLGSWISGEQTTWAMRSLAVEGKGVTVITPGLEPQEILELMERFCPSFPQTLLISYPPFAKSIVEEAAARGLPLRSYHLKLGLVGEGYSERFREYMGEILGHESGDVMAVWSGYGSADFGAVGQETPLTITIRRLIHSHGAARAVLGSDEIPGIYQYNPVSLHLEAVDGELVITRRQAVPLVRYRTGDRGAVIPCGEILSRLEWEGIEPERSLKDRDGAGLPLVLVYGRADGTVTFYGAKISAEQVREVLDTPALRLHFTGRFRMRVVADENLNPRLEIEAEGRPGREPPGAAEAARLVADELCRINSEYASSLAGAGSLPVIVPASSDSFEGGLKLRYI